MCRRTVVPAVSGHKTPQVNKGPVDAITTTSEARCSLSEEEKLIRQSVDYKPMTVRVSISPQTAYLSGVDPNLQADNLEIPVKVLDCDDQYHHR